MKILKKFWGVALVVILLSTLFFSAVPVSAAQVLRWENKTDTPISLFNVLAPHTDVIDYAVNGATMYAITHSYLGAVAQITTTYGTGGTYAFTYVNQDGVAGRAGSVTIPALAVAGATPTFAVVLQAGDTGIMSIPTQAAVVTGGPTLGAFQIQSGNNAATVLATSTTAGAFTTTGLTGSNSALLQSTSGGAMWTNITAKLMTAAIAPIFVNGMNYVAIAADNPAIVVVSTAVPTATGRGVAITTNAGLTFTDMGIVTDATNTNFIAAIDGIDISPTVAGGFRYVAVYGTNNAALASVYYYNYGTGVGSWKDALLDFTPAVKSIPAPVTAGGTLDRAPAFRFSPLFTGDYMAVAVLYDATTGALELHQVSFNAGGHWDTETGYPSIITTDSGVLPSPYTAVNKVSLVLNPAYDGSDDSSRIAFIGTDVIDTLLGPSGGIYRALDASVGRISGAAAKDQIWSVAFDGTNLAAGLSTSNNVVRSTNALASNPSFSSARNLKRIGTADVALADKVIVLYADTTLYGGKSGTGSCISKSTDYGNTWNDYTLIDDNYQVAGAIDDIYVTAAGDPWYMSTSDGVTTNVYRIAAFSATRVLCVPTGVNFKLRGLDTTDTIIYAADTTVGLDIYYSADAGLTRWFKRSSPAALSDLAVDSATTIYVGAAFSANIYKSTNEGFTWSTPINSGLIVFVNNLYALGDGKVVAGGIVGDVTYTADGGNTWAFTIGTWGTPALVSASGLGEGDYLFAADMATANVYRCLLGSANPFGEWQTMNAPISTPTEVNTGIVYKSGVLFTLANDPVGVVGPPAIPAQTYINRTTAPTVPGTHLGFFWSTTFADPAQRFANVDALAASVANNVFTIYAINTTAKAVRYFQDTLALASPILTGPADGALIQLTSQENGTAQDVNFTWNRISLATNYLLFIALDAGFTQPIGAPIAVASSSPIVSSIVGGAAFNPGNTYYWRVMATAPLSSGFSETRSFTVVANAASVPDLASPQIGTTIQPSQIAFSWTPTAGTTSYQFQLDTGATFTAPLYSATVTSAGASLPPTVNLERGRMYFWRVKALTPTEGDWSTVGNFIVAQEVTTSATTSTTTTTTVTTTQITIPPSTSTIITFPATTQTVNEVNPTYIWAIIIIGAVLVLAVIVLIVRTRRSV